MINKIRQGKCTGLHYIMLTEERPQPFLAFKQSDQGLYCCCLTL